MGDMISGIAVAVGNVFRGRKTGCIDKRLGNLSVAERVGGIPAASPDKAIEQRRMVR